MDYRDPEWLANRLGLEKNTVYKLLQDGTIPAVQLGRKWLVSESRLAQWLREEADRQTDARRQAASSTERTVRRMDNFSPLARSAIRLAHTEARRYSHTYLGQEHLLLGLLGTSACVAARVLGSLGVTLEDIRRQFEAALQPGDTTSPKRLGRTVRAKRAMRLAAREAGRKGLVGSEHLLLGLLLAGEGMGYDLLTAGGITPDRVRSQLAQLQDLSPGENNETGN